MIVWQIAHKIAAHSKVVSIVSLNFQLNTTKSRKTVPLLGCNFPNIGKFIHEGSGVQFYGYVTGDSKYFDSINFIRGASSFSFLFSFFIFVKKRKRRIKMKMCWKHKLCRLVSQSKCKSHKQSFMVWNGSACAFNMHPISAFECIICMQSQIE